MVMVTKNFIIGSCTESLEMDEEGRFILSHSDIEVAPSFLTREQASAWCAKHSPHRSPPAEIYAILTKTSREPAI